MKLCVKSFVLFLFSEIQIVCVHIKQANAHELINGKRYESTETKQIAVGQYEVCMLYLLRVDDMANAS